MCDRVGGITPPNLEKIKPPLTEARSPCGGSMDGRRWARSSPIPCPLTSPPEPGDQRHAGDAPIRPFPPDSRHHLGPGSLTLNSGRLVTAKQEQVVDPVVGGQEALCLPRQLEALICRSRHRVGWCEFSARLFSPLCFLCSADGITWHLAAL